MTFYDDERALFAGLERDLATDLSVWKAKTLDLRERLLMASYTAFKDVTGRFPDLDVTVDVWELSVAMKHQLMSQWRSQRDAPIAGDILELSGRGFVQTISGEGVYIPIPMHEGQTLVGTLSNLDVQSYLDPAFMRVYEELPEDQVLSESSIAGYYRPFGVHLVVEDVSELDDNGVLIPLEDISTIHVPLDNPDMRILKQII